MAESCLWSILILTIPPRAAMLARLLSVLRPQVEAANAGHWPAPIELLVREYDPAVPLAPLVDKEARREPNRPVGENRELLRRAAKGEYISFIDDDDLVSPNYVGHILPLLDGVDHIGFNLEQRLDGRGYGAQGVHYRSLRWRQPCFLPPGGLCGHYADFSHLEPMRRELALAVPMSGWPSDDVRWAEDLRKLNIVQTEHYVDETLYYYLTRTSKPELKGSSGLLPAEGCPWIYMTKVKVKMLTGIAGNANPAYDLPEHGYSPEEIVELHPYLAERWIASGLAEAVPDEKPVKKGASGPAKPVPEPRPISPVPVEPSPVAPQVVEDAGEESGLKTEEAEPTRPAPRSRRSTN